MSIKSIPMCWKCKDALVQLEEDYGLLSSFQKTLIGCSACDTIKNYEDAKTMCPLLIPEDWECPTCGERECPGCEPHPSQQLSSFL